METTRTQISIAPNLPQKKGRELAAFGLLHLLVAGMVSLAFIGKAAVSELHPVSIPSSGAAMTTHSHTHPGFYGRAPR